MQERIHGTTMPVLEIMLEPDEGLLSESGELSWLSQSIQLSTNTGGGGLKGVFKRVAGGGTLFMTTYTAQGVRGTVAFAAKLPGTILKEKIDGTPQGTWLTHRHGFVCASQGVELTVGFQQSLGAGLFGGNGLLLQKVAGQGDAWFELSGEWRRIVPRSADGTGTRLPAITHFGTSCGIDRRVSTHRRWRRTRCSRNWWRSYRRNPRWNSRQRRLIRHSQLLSGSNSLFRPLELRSV